MAVTCGAIHIYLLLYFLCCQVFRRLFADAHLSYLEMLRLALHQSTLPFDLRVDLGAFFSNTGLRRGLSLVVCLIFQW